MAARSSTTQPQFSRHNRFPRPLLRASESLNSQGKRGKRQNQSSNLSNERANSSIGSAISSIPRANSPLPPFPRRVPSFRSGVPAFISSLPPFQRRVGRLVLTFDAFISQAEQVLPSAQPRPSEDHLSKSHVRRPAWSPHGLFSRAHQFHSHAHAGRSATQSIISRTRGNGRVPWGRRGDPCLPVPIRVLENQLAR